MVLSVLTDGTIDLGTSLAGAGTAITTQVGAVLPVALPIAGALIAVTIGWRYFKRFVRG